jgi:protein-S-isoprenylcysteine O-methyltransferase Ste14
MSLRERSNDQVCSRRPLDPTVGSVKFDFIGPLHRAINMIVALTLVPLGGGGVVYFYFIDTTWPRWITIVPIIVGAAGLYWLWEEHVNLGQQSGD